jgi:hypothetical protein
MHHSFISLLRNYKAEDETICQIIGFKFQSLNQQETAIQQKSSLDTPDITNTGSSTKTQGLDQQTQQDFNFFQSQHVQFKNSHLYTVAAYLLKYNMIDLDLLMPHVNHHEL